MANCSDRERECSSFADTCRCEKSATDETRERLVVSRLDRYELEDRHLRVLEELSSAKKLANEQSDKIKRLATKLMRFGANPRACGLDDQDRVALLESENCKLRDKVCALRNQLVNRKIFGRSPSRGRKQPLGYSSGANTCRSENSRLKTSSCQCLNAPFTNDEQNQAIKLQLEVEKKAMQLRIEQLELEFASCASGNRREKVAENVEYIRILRQMKRQNEKLDAAQAANEMLSQQIGQMKSQLEESRNNNQQLSAVLECERKQFADLDDNASKYKNSQSDLREKNERISDLSNEVDILKQHNHELLDLSSKFGRVEQENVELKRRLSEQSVDQQSLKDELDKEKANMQALEAANEQLLAKVNGLQKSLDVMSIQLMGQNERSAASQRTPKASRGSQTASNELSITPSQESVQACNNCCGIPMRKKPAAVADKGIQVCGDQQQSTSKSTQTDSAKSRESCDNNKAKFQLSRGHSSNSLSRENMLRLLEQVQIGSPMETQPVAMMRPVSNLEAVLFGDS
ncbi:protein fantom-like isoform X2 [Phymastichus coffea]|uniref:protein fantom-like isoform X2 n=1 Tax=Phymastichus coffea TaxID=108790 RepID=UPI00273CB425|nr:protein fantom-like isoform X2 [Phymastichus coffea]